MQLANVFQRVSGSVGCDLDLPDGFEVGLAKLGSISKKMPMKFKTIAEWGLEASQNCEQDSLGSNGVCQSVWADSRCLPGIPMATMAMTAQCNSKMFSEQFQSLCLMQFLSQ